MLIGLPHMFCMPLKGLLVHITISYSVHLRLNFFGSQDFSFLQHEVNISLTCIISSETEWIFYSYFFFFFFPSHNNTTFPICEVEH